MHLRGEPLTLTDTMHIAMAVVTVLLMLLAIGFGTAALGKWFRLYSIATLVILVAFGTLTFLDAPRIAAKFANAVDRCLGARQHRRFLAMGRGAGRRSLARPRYCGWEK